MRRRRNEIDTTATHLQELLERQLKQVRGSRFPGTLAGRIVIAVLHPPDTGVRIRRHGIPRQIITQQRSRVDPGAIAQEYSRLFAQGEPVHAAYQLVRDVFIFTNRRLILVDKQGVTGRKVQYHSIP